ncbi:MAG TPA: aminotransferase class V-fold PLP-dependent enzyme [Gemmatimonadaceae bacterium]|nr:aminotransferase class V-fold PLP-dependent enzyme [Gemmatimonadaceae bacterium]
MSRTPRQLERWRADTPGVANRVHLNNAGAALMPTPVHARVEAHLRQELAVGGYAAADAAAAAVAESYAHLARLLGAAPRNIAVVENATVGVLQAVSAFDLAAGDAIVTTRCEYVSSQLLFLSLARRRGVRVLRAPDLPEGGVDPDGVRRLLAREPRVRLVTATWVPTNSGLVQDVEAVGAVCEERGIPYLVDATQAVGQFPIDVARLRCDYLAATARKFLRGPRGVGFLYVADRALARGDYPLFIDLHGATWTAPDEFVLAPSARRFENWEFAYALVLGQGEAARYALDVGVAEGGSRAIALAAGLRERLAALPGVRPLDRGRTPCAIVTAAIAGRDARDVVAALAARGVNASATLREYGVLDMDEKGATTAVRLSPHYYNTEEEIDFAMGGVEELLRTA